MFEDDARSAGETGQLNDNAQGEAIPMGMHTRYRGRAMSWLALGALLATWHSPARADRPSAESARSGNGATSTGQPSQLWLARAAQSRTWIARAPHGVVRSVADFATQPEFSSLASVRTARRWLRTL